MLELDLISKDGSETTNIPLSPGRIDHAVIGEGQTKVYTPAEDREAPTAIDHSHTHPENCAGVL